MPDNWGFVAAAYALTAVVLGLYWRHLVRKEKELEGGGAQIGRSRSNVAGTTGAHMERAQESSRSNREVTEHSREPSRSGHPRPDPSTRGPRQP